MWTLSNGRTLLNTHTHIHTAFADGGMGGVKDGWVPCEKPMASDRMQRLISQRYCSLSLHGTLTDSHSNDGRCQNHFLPSSSHMNKGLLVWSHFRTSKRHCKSVLCSVFLCPRAIWLSLHRSTLVTCSVVPSISMLGHTNLSPLPSLLLFLGFVLQRWLW